MGASNADLGRLVDELRARGQRITTARRAVLEQLLDAGQGHMAVDELAARVQAEHPDIHLSTVYRTLDVLTSVGILVNVRLGDGPSSYHLADDAHHHAVCDTCGRVIELEGEVFEPVVDRLMTEHGFLARPVHLSIGGRCQDCL